MGSKTWQLMDIELRIKDDPEAGLLLDQLLDACFEIAPLPNWAPAESAMLETQTNTDRISSALKRLNTYLKEHGILQEGIQPPANIALSDWAEDITMQILTNGAY